MRSGSRPGRAVVDGRERLVLCSNDYLGLAADPRVVEGACAAARRYGAGATAARALSGDTDLHRELEAELAAFKGAEAALAFSSGYLTNIGVIASLAADVIYSDELNHASIIDGARLSSARSVVYAHADPRDLEARLEPGRGVVVTDAVFSMDGDVAPVAELLDLGAFTVLDDAHATGVLGPAGEGSLAELAPGRHAGLVIGTLGKALGSAGGFVAGDAALIEDLRARSRPYLFDTAPAPATVGAALAALAVLREEPERVARVRANGRELADGLRRLGHEVPEPAAGIVVVPLGAEHLAHELAASLFERDVVVHGIGPPYVPAGTSRLRLLATAAHDAADMERILTAFEQGGVLANR